MNKYSEDDLANIIQNVMNITSDHVFNPNGSVIEFEQNICDYINTLKDNIIVEDIPNIAQAIYEGISNLGIIEDSFNNVDHFKNLLSDNQELDMKKRMLLIVDPQIDFINGSLPVPGAEETMNNLARYLHDFGNCYDNILITCDRHPLRHCSFKEFGGEWPPHCVESSVGAAVWPAIMKELPPFSLNTRFLYKGEDPNKDEYSIFGSEKGAREMDAIIRKEEVTHIDICGLAGDVCVKTTLEDAISLYPHIHYRVLEDCVASLDGGEAIK